MDDQFKNKKVIVTGGGKGIGRAICVHFAKLQAHVIAISRTQSDLDTLKEEYSSIETHRADITDWDVMEKLLVDIGPVDCLVNNAGVCERMPILEVTKQKLDNDTDINYKAAFHVSQVVAKQMIEHNKEGSIVNMSSIAGLQAVPGLSTYSISKAALDMMTQNFAAELGPHKIRVNGLNPTLVMSGMGRRVPADRLEQHKKGYPLGRVLEEEDVINAVQYLLGDNSSMVTGVNLKLDGGYTLAFK